MSGVTTSPIAFEYHLGCTPEDAFGAYTGRIGEWWDGRYTANPETLQAVTIEPRVGGRVSATHSDFGIDDWGEVTVWEPGRRLVHTFTLAQDPLEPSEVTVDFESADVGGCTVSFAHGGWTDANAGNRTKFGDWQVLLDRFAAIATAES